MSFPNFDLTGRVALITGAGRGIGMGMAHALAAYGCAVAIQDIELDVARETAAGLEKSGARALALGGDITDLSLPAQLIEQTQRELGGLHILINNAAIQKEEPWLQMLPDEFEREWRANLIAPVLLCQLAVPIFRTQKWGRIISLGSIQGKGGNSGALAYAMSKAALENMTKGIARDLGGDGITVNMISPGYYNTWRNRDQFQTPEDFEKRSQWIPLKRIGEPEDCGGAALLLCSEAGSYITGQNFYVDGGLSAR
jgi:NAD(P)-dependent dehydrogenase (short-subunit alcohol dehydrogenase family)